MFMFKVLAHPLNEVVFKHPLDELVEQIWSDKLVNIGIGEVFCEGLEPISHRLREPRRGDLLSLH